MPLTTHCGRCGHLFPVYAQELRSHRGRTRCPQCGHRFNGLAALIDEPMLGREATNARARLGFGPRRAPSRAHRAPETPYPVPADAEARQADRTAPTQDAKIGRGGRVARAGWTLATLGLLLVLPAQLAWWMRADLLRRPEARPVLEAFCDRVGCTPPAPRLAGTLQVLEPSLVPRPGPETDLQATTLVLALQVRNAAPLAQPMPVVELEVLDAQGALAASRRFAPDRYGIADPTRLLAPGETLPISLELQSPPIETSGFRVRLL